jgi:hypothetical protein
MDIARITYLNTSSRLWFDPEIIAKSSCFYVREQLIRVRIHVFEEQQ